MMSSPNNLFAAIDMGTNSFKLLIVRADPTTGRFLTMDRHKEAVVLGRDSTPNISISSQARAIESLRKFQKLLNFHSISPSNYRIVATSAVRESNNQSQFLSLIHQTLGFQVDVVSGYDEARLTYLGVLQFHPVYDQRVLTIDIGGGSTEFVIGVEGKVLLGTSLKLGHVTLTHNFVNRNEIGAMREHIRLVIKESGLIDKFAQYKFDIVIGSSGTIRMIEKAVFFGYCCIVVNGLGLFEGIRKDWKFSSEDLRSLVEELCREEREGDKVMRDVFFKKRSQFILAGAILLEEIFGLIGIKEMEVSQYALGEGVITEKLAEAFDVYDLNANARWRSVLQLASRFNNKKRIKSAALCAVFAKGIFEGLRRWSEVDDCQNRHIPLDDKDLEYLEAASLLHNIGLFTGKKGYHKQSYRIIMGGELLHGYNNEEVKLIALLARHHRKKFPKLDHDSLQEFTDEVKEKFRILCTIIRLSAILKQYESLNVQDIELSHSQEGFKLVVNATGTQSVPSDIKQSLSANMEAELEEELDHFHMSFQALQNEQETRNRNSQAKQFIFRSLQRSQHQEEPRDLLLERLGWKEIYECQSDRQVETKNFIGQSLARAI